MIPKSFYCVKLYAQNTCIKFDLIVFTHPWVEHSNKAFIFQQMLSGHPVYKYALALHNDKNTVYQNNERLEFLSVADGYSDAFPRCHCLGSTMSKIPCLPFVK